MSRGEEEKRNDISGATGSGVNECSASDAGGAARGCQASASHSAPRIGAGRLPRKLPAAIVYWTLGVAFVILALGLTTRPKESLNADRGGVGMHKAAVEVASVAAGTSSADDPTGGFHFFIMLGPQRSEWHGEAWAGHLESRLKAKLARDGFPNIGVSVSRDGAVFLAGTLFDGSEKWMVERIVERTPGVESVHFPHPEIRKLYGPAYLGIETERAHGHAGVKVTKVWSGSPASMAGIRTGDVIVTFDGRRVRGPQTFRYLVASHIGGQRVPVTLDRGRRERRVTVRLGETRALVLD